MISKKFALKTADSNTGAFLWILQNFYEHAVWRISANDCLCISANDNYILFYDYSLRARDGFTQPIFYKSFDRFGL